MKEQKPSQTPDPRDAEIAELKQRIETISTEANATIAAITRQRNEALNQSAMLEAELTLLKQQPKA